MYRMRRINKTPTKPKVEKKTPAPVAPKVDTKVQEQMLKVQTEATLAMTEVAAQAINNPQLEQLIQLLSQPKPEQLQQNKRLTVNRGSNGLIESIDIKAI